MLVLLKSCGGARIRATAVAFLLIALLQGTSTYEDVMSSYGAIKENPQKISVRGAFGSLPDPTAPFSESHRAAGNPSDMLEAESNRECTLKEDAQLLTLRMEQNAYPTEQGKKDCADVSTMKSRSVSPPRKKPDNRALRMDERKKSKDSSSLDLTMMPPLTNHQPSSNPASRTWASPTSQSLYGSSSPGPISSSSGTRALSSPQSSKTLMSTESIVDIDKELEVHSMPMSKKRKKAGSDEGADMAASGIVDGADQLTSSYHEEANRSTSLHDKDPELFSYTQKHLSAEMSAAFVMISRYWPSGSYRRTRAALFQEQSKYHGEISPDLHGEMPCPNPELYPEEGKLKELAFAKFQVYYLKHSFHHPRGQECFERIHRLIYGLELEFPFKPKSSSIGSKNRFPPEKVRQIGTVVLEKGSHQVILLGLASPLYALCEGFGTSALDLNQSEGTYQLRRHWIARALPILIHEVRVLCQAFPKILAEKQMSISQLQINAWHFFKNFCETILQAQSLGLSGLELKFGGPGFNQSQKIAFVTKSIERISGKWTSEYALSLSRGIMALWMSEVLPRLYRQAKDRITGEFEAFFKCLLCEFDLMEDLVWGDQMRVVG